MDNKTKCMHGQTPIARVCCSADCKLPALVCLACEQCVTVHEHNGVTTLRKPDALLAQITKALSGWRTNQAAISERTEDLNEQIEALAELLSQDIKNTITAKKIKPNLQRLILKIQAHDESVLGSDVSQLIQSLEKKDVYMAADELDNRSQQLQEIFEGFVKAFNKLSGEYENKRMSILNAKPKSSLIVPKKPPIPAKTEIREPQKQASLAVRKFEQPKTSPTLSKEVIISQNSRKISMSAPDSEAESDDNGDNGDEGWRTVAPKKQKPKTPSSSESSDSQAQKPKSEFIYIEDIQPGAENFNIIAKVCRLIVQVLSTQSTLRNNKTFIRCVLGDETGVVTASLFPFEHLVPDAILQFRHLRAYVDYGQIVVNTIHANSISPSKEKIESVNNSLDISAKIWKKQHVTK